MRSGRALAGVGLVLLAVSACGRVGGENSVAPAKSSPHPNAAQTSVNQAPRPVSQNQAKPQPDDPWKDVPEPEVNPDDKWLWIDAVRAGDTWQLEVYGRRIQPNSKELRNILVEYASRVDPAAELAGISKEGIREGLSENPVVFCAPPEASSQLFLSVIETCAHARIWRFVVECSPADVRPRQLWHCLPVDDYLSPPPPEMKPEIETESPKDDGAEPEAPGAAPEGELLEEEGWKPRPRIDLALVFAEDGTCRFRTRINGKQGKLHIATKFMPADLTEGRWNDALYLKLRKAMAIGLRSRQGQGRDAISQVDVASKSGKQYIPWGALFLAMDAAELANNAPERGDRPKLFVTHRFTDALGRYGD
jgi:hypothetical protein